MSTPNKDEQAGPHKYKGTLTFEDLLKTVLYVVSLHDGDRGL